MKYNSLIPELTVSDIEQTRRFYVDVLQFKVEYERVEDLFLFLSKEGNQMMFQQENDVWNTGEMEYPFGRGINFEMTVSDVNALYQRVLDANIPPFKALQVHNYRSNEELIEQNEFLVQDPDGYLLRFTD